MDIHKQEKKAELRTENISEDEKPKRSTNKHLIEKIIKENSFRKNSSLLKSEQKEASKKKTLHIESMPLLQLKVLTSTQYLAKGTTIQISAIGLSDYRKDCISYFGVNSAKVSNVLENNNHNQ